MKIGIIGGTGNAGRALCAEAVSRGSQLPSELRLRSIRFIRPKGASDPADGLAGQ
jgi:hypothetical protein